MHQESSGAQPCEVCGRAFHPHPSQVGRRRFCSMGCRRTSEGRVTLICQWCGATFSRKASKVRSGRAAYCGKACADRGRLGLLVDRLRDGIDASGGPDACWPWKGAVHSRGYGKITVGQHNGRLLTETTHRAMWRTICGEIPPGLFVLHRCDNRPCCNPRHLFLGTHRDNMRDMAIKGRAGGRRLTDRQVRELREQYRLGVPSSVLAREYGLAVSTVGHIVDGRSYRYVGGAPIGQSSQDPPG